MDKYKRAILHILTDHYLKSPSFDYTNFVVTTRNIATFPSVISVRIYLSNFLTSFASSFYKYSPISLNSTILVEQFIYFVICKNPNPTKKLFPHLPRFNTTHKRQHVSLYIEGVSIIQILSFPFTLQAPKHQPYRNSPISYTATCV
jgi:hypothetical protein